MDDPSADEGLPPDHSDFPTLTLSKALSFPLGNSDPRLTFPSLERSGETLESESTKERKKEEGAARECDQEVNLADHGIRQVNEDEFRLALVPEDVQNAIDLATAG